MAKLRLEDTVPPGIDRYYGEQIVAYLLTNEYLREDFHYTAYQTISYIVKGGRRATDDMKFAGARILKLPPLDREKNIAEVPEIKKEEAESSNPLKKTWRKRRISSSDEKPIAQNKSVRKSRSDSVLTNDSDKSSKVSISSSPIVTTNSINIEEIINQKVETQLKKYFGKITPAKEPTVEEPEKITTNDDDCVLVTPPKCEVIDIIDIDD